MIDTFFKYLSPVALIVAVFGIYKYFNDRKRAKNDESKASLKVLYEICYPILNGIENKLLEYIYENKRELNVLKTTNEQISNSRQEFKIAVKNLEDKFQFNFEKIEDVNDIDDETKKYLNNLTKRIADKPELFINLFKGIIESKEAVENQFQKTDKIISDTSKISKDKNAKIAKDLEDKFAELEKVSFVGFRLGSKIKSELFYIKNELVEFVIDIQSEATKKGLNNENRRTDKAFDLILKLQKIDLMLTKEIF